MKKKELYTVVLFLIIGMFAHAQQLQKGLYVGETFK